MHCLYRPIRYPIELSSELYDLFRIVFTFLSVSSLFVGATGFFQTYVGFVLLGLVPDFRICFAMFLMTFSLYSLNKLTDIKEDGVNMPERLRFLEGKKKLIIAYSSAAYLLCMVLAALDQPSSLLIVLVPLAANAAYGSRLIPGAPRLKDIPVMKNLVVAISWALTTALLPAAHTMYAVSGIAIVLYFMLVKAFVNTALYDVRDIVGDKENGVRTMPVLIGQKKTVALLLVLNSTLLPVIAMMCQSVRVLAAAMIAYGYIYIIYFRVRRDPLIMDLFVDGEWMIACVALMLWNWPIASTIISSIH